jgi:UDP-glucose 4-epimerase
MRALVTGGAGFIGSNVVDGLRERGHDVVVLDDLSTGQREHVPADVDLVEADVADPAAVAAVMAEHRPEVIFHLAAQIDVRRSVADPAFDARVNVEGTIAVLEAARATGARVVFSSTGGAIYGDTDVVPTPETAPRRPLAPYGQAKAAAEDYCGLYARLHRVAAVALRYANVYGDGRQTRDFVYVGDVVEANLLAATSGASGAFNVGRGEETTVLELADQLGLEVEHAPERPGEVLRSCLDPSLAQRELGWRARVDLAEGIRRTLAWTPA